MKVEVEGKNEQKINKKLECKQEQKEGIKEKEKLNQNRGKT